MQVHYSVQSVAETLDLEEATDIKSLVEALEVELRTRHPGVNSNKHLLVSITDGVLNALASNENQITLGELAAGGDA